MKDNNKLHFNLFQEIYHNNKLSHVDEIKNIYAYETVKEDGDEIILNCIEIKETNAPTLPIEEIDKFKLRVDKKNKSVDISRHGIVKSDMFFSVNERSTFIHDSYLGKISFTLSTTNIDINDDYIEIIYDLLNEDELLSKNKVKILIK